MSTKIYAGFRMAPGKTLEDAFAAVSTFRGLAAKHQRRIVAKAKAWRAANKADYSNHQLAPAEREIEAEEVSIVFYPHAGRVYGIAFMPHDYEKMWFESSGVTPWGYWNNTDRPHDVSEQEWEERRNTWDKILGDSQTFALGGLIAKCLGYPPYVTADEVLAEMPTVEERARRLAIDVLADESGIKRVSDYAEFMTWLGSTEGKTKLDTYTEKFVRGLDRNVTKATIESVL